MTDQEINIVIADACGWTFKRIIHKESYPIQETLDYCHDLNAMHEAENSLDIVQQVNYVAELWKCNPKSSIPVNIWNQSKLSQEIWWTLTNSTAIKRAKAFLRAKELWKG